jgi:peptidoglycan/LPS O-acetylase OafA/YrhL
MKVFSYVYEKLKRETSSENFIPQVDGLRFLAIMTVVFYHIQLFFIAKTPFAFNYNSILYVLAGNGFKGVEIFFVLSGFILGLPFARYFLLDGKKPNLKNYYFRRLTRIEPPYLIALVLFLGLHVIKNIYPVKELLIGFFFNFFYIQNFAWFHIQPIIGNITWTLEIEVQFYLIAPFLASVFILNKVKRRFILIVAIVLLPIINTLFIFPFVSLYQYLFYFLIGFLLADLYLTEKSIRLNNVFLFIIGAVAFVIFYLISIESVFHKLIFAGCLFIFMHLVLTTSWWRKIFSYKSLTAIGGMCYSIYLLHTVVISGFGNATVFWNISSRYDITLLMQTIILLPLILIISFFYFIFVEKPCMDKSWPEKVRVYVKTILFKIKNLDKSL